MTGRPGCRLAHPGQSLSPEWRANPRCGGHGVRIAPAGGIRPAPQFHMAELTLACRLQSNRQLATLAHKLTPHYTWDDLILLADRLQQWREPVRPRPFAPRATTAGGLTGVWQGPGRPLCGPAGTGKTMAAEVLAGHLRLDLYRSISPLWSVNTSARRKKTSPASLPKPPPERHAVF